MKRELPKSVKLAQRKLTKEQAQDILDSTINTPAIKLANEYNVSVKTIKDIRARRSWTHLQRS
jgi:hypothetical protein